MEKLKQYPDLTIREVAEKYGIRPEILRDRQLEMLRKHLKRDSELWEVNGYGR